MPKKVYPERSRRGYTLIELLIAAAIISVLSAVVFINFRTFSQDQILNKAAGEIQSILREAQSNATSSFACSGSGGVSWAVKFKQDKVSLDLTCGASDFAQKAITLKDAEIASIQCSPKSLECPPKGSTFNPPLTISFSPLYGNVTFAEGDSCISQAQTLMIALKSQKNDNYKCFTVSKGGAIDIK